jgi:hypothetical protein
MYSCNIIDRDWAGSLALKARHCISAARDEQALPAIPAGKFD